MSLRLNNKQCTFGSNHYNLNDSQLKALQGSNGASVSKTLQKKSSSKTPFGFISTYYDGISSFRLSTKDKKIGMNNPKMNQISNEGQQIFNILTDRYNHLYYISHAEKRVIRVDLATQQHALLCSLVLPNSTYMGDKQGSLAINPSGDLLFVKKSEYLVSIFCLNPQDQNVVDALNTFRPTNGRVSDPSYYDQEPREGISEVLLKVKTRPEMILGSNLTENQARKVIHSIQKDAEYQDVENGIASILPFTVIDGDKISEKLILVLKDGFINIWQLMTLRIKEQDPNATDIEEQGAEATPEPSATPKAETNQKRKKKRSENQESEADRTHMSTTKSGSQGEGHGGDNDDHLLLDLFSKSRKMKLNEKVMKAVLSDCNHYFLLASFYKRKADYGDIQRLYRDEYEVFESTELENHREFRVVFRLYYIDQKTANLTFLSKYEFSVNFSKIFAKRIHSTHQFSYKPLKSILFLHQITHFHYFFTVLQISFFLMF